MDISDYCDFLRGTLSNNTAVLNYKDYIIFNSIGPINLLEPFRLSNFQLKNLVAQHNRLRINNFNRFSLARALRLDYYMYEESYLNIIKHLPLDIEKLNQEFVNYQHELDFLNAGLKSFNSSADDEKYFFEVFKKRQLTYHWDMLERLLCENKFGLNLNREIKLVGGVPTRDLFTIGQQKIIIASSSVKFLYPNANDFNYLVKDFTSSDQAYQELIENTLYVQLKYILSFKRLEFLNKSISLTKFYTTDGLTISEKENLIQEINADLEKVCQNHLKKNSFFYNLLGDYYQYRSLTKSNKGCRVDLFENMHKNYSLISFLLSKGKPLYGVTSQPTSTLGLNTARDFAFNSPFVNPYETKDMPVRPNSRYTY